jgi:hypothetical protein
VPLPPRLRSEGGYGGSGGAAGRGGWRGVGGALAGRWRNRWRRVFVVGGALAAYSGLMAAG